MQASPGDFSELDRRVRRVVFDTLMRTGAAPTLAAVAETTNSVPAEIRDSYRRLGDAHVFILQDTGALMAANPFAAIPTPFQIWSNAQQWSAMCVWDALGIPAMLGIDAEVRTTCGDCNGAVSLRIAGGELRATAGDGVIHFAVPAKRWWENIVFS